MKEIALDKGLSVIVDDEDYDWLLPYKWYAAYAKSGDRYYAHCSVKGETIIMHRLILGITCSKTRTDHKNLNGLDNRRENIRACTASQNAANSPARGGTSRFKGVYLRKQNNRWVARITYNRKSVALGNYATEQAAAIAYNNKAIELFGEFAYLNQLTNDDIRVAEAKEYKGRGICKYRGVAPMNKKWQAKISINRKSICIGCFSSEKEAAIAYNIKATELLGEKAVLNEL